MKRRWLSMALIVAIMLMGLNVAWADQTYTAKTPLGSSGAKRNNIQIAADRIDDYEVESGETFSFNKVVGPRTESRGYESAENGRGVRVTGGGVSQVAATLYLALLKMEDVEFTDLHTYGSRFTDDYVSSGDLAVVTDYSAGTDFRFKNHGGDMRISLWLSSNYLNCAITVEGDGGSGWFDDDDDDDDGVDTVDVSGNDQDTMDNVILAAGSVFDTTLEHNDRFSFNKVVGPRTEKYGYGSGTNGRGVRVTGGGVAQVASAIWLAVKDRDDVSIIEKSTYGSRYNQDYVDSSADAIVTDYKAGTDFSFKYTGYDTMTLYTYVDGDELKCDVVIN